ncbi:pol polyprotein [Vairimorpha apis BRL 01]|uniref:Pol polyprotein n=1 Tax=Vairimorpha apis BRL 01 TaxID=1037528 RepID=T0LDJ4_9MICR|nr:pol polyprotein [Vairimorpha apis BRL 01]
MLKRLLEHEVKINFEKSKIGMKEVEVLGYRVNNKGIFPIFTDKTSKLLNRNIKTRKEVQRLVGLLNWYRKFIPNLSERICEITNLLKGRKDDKKITVTRQIKDEINKLSKIIANESKLDFPDFSKKFTLECDAPDMGIGSVLRQEDKIIGYYSKKLQGPELNYKYS